LHAQALLACQLKDIKNTFELTFLSKYVKIFILPACHYLIVNFMLCHSAFLNAMYLNHLTATMPWFDETLLGSSPAYFIPVN